MGTNHFGIAVYGATPTDLIDTLTTWLRQRGFERQHGPLPRHLYDDQDRAAVVYAAERAAVISFSDLGELQRLLFELRKLGRPTLLAYMHDSSMAGYELWVDHKPVSAWSSEPDDPEVPGPDDLDALAAATGSDRQQLARLRGRRAVFTESVTTPLFAALGAAPLAGSWDDPFDAPHEEVWYRQEGFDPWAGFDLQAARFQTASGPAPDPAAAPPAALPSGCLFITMRVVLTPLGWLLRLYMRWRGTPALSMPWEVDGDTLRHPEFGATWRLPPDASSVDSPLVQEHDVFVVRLDQAMFMLQESWPEQLRQLSTLGPPGAELVDRQETLAGHPARRLLATAPGGGWMLYVWIHPPGRLLLLRAASGEPMSEAFPARIDALLAGLHIEA